MVRSLLAGLVPGPTLTELMVMADSGTVAPESHSAGECHGGAVVDEHLAGRAPAGANEEGGAIPW